MPSSSATYSGSSLTITDASGRTVTVEAWGPIEYETAAPLDVIRQPMSMSVTVPIKLSPESLDGVRRFMDSMSGFWAAPGRRLDKQRQRRIQARKLRRGWN